MAAQNYLGNKFQTALFYKNLLFPIDELDKEIIFTKQRCSSPIRQLLHYSCNNLYNSHIPSQKPWSTKKSKASTFQRLLIFWYWILVCPNQFAFGAAANVRR